MHARFERIKAAGRGKMEVLGFQGAKEAFNRGVVKAVAFAAHALRDSARRKHRAVRLHLVVPALIRMNDQFAGATGARKLCPERSRDQFEDGALCHAVRDDLAVVQVHAGRQIELFTVHIERKRSINDVLEPTRPS